MGKGREGGVRGIGGGGQVGLACAQDPIFAQLCGPRFGALCLMVCAFGLQGC